MKKISLHFLSFVLIVTGITSVAKAQITGTKTIGIDYPSLNVAITILNVNGVGSGGVIINIPAGYTETAPINGYVLTATGTFSNQIVFKKMGTGVNPVITAAVINSATEHDAVFKLSGSDYVTIDGIDIVENAANNTSTLYTDWAFAFVKKNATAPFDGCQYNTIRNCNISLSRNNISSIGIYGGNHVATSTIDLSLTATTDANSYNTFQSNIISNVYCGFSIVGCNTTSFYDVNNKIGGSAVLLGNTIRNFGGSTTAAYGINLNYQKNDSVLYNTISNAGGGGVANQAAITGIVSGSGTLAAFTALYNNITTTIGAGSGDMVGFLNNGTATYTNVSYNTFQAFSTSGTNAYYGIYSPVSGTIGTETYSFNNFNNISLNTSGTATLVFCNNANTGIVISDNYITGSFTRTVTSSNNFYGIYRSGAPASGAAQVSNNNISNISAVGTGTVAAINISSSPAQVHTITGNIINNINAGAGKIYGIWAQETLSSNVSGNTVSNLTTTYAANPAAIGISANSGVPGNVSSVVENKIGNIRANGTVYGCYIDGTSSILIYKNKISGLQVNTNASAVAYGIVATASIIDAIIYNNFISEMNAPASTIQPGVTGIYLPALSGFMGVYHNTIYLNATASSSSFSSTGIYTDASRSLELINNILVNVSAHGASGKTVAFWRSDSLLNSYSTESNNNCYYAGTPGVSNLIFFDGTNTDQTLAQFKTRVLSRDNASFTENVPFINTATSPYDLHLNVAVATQCESGSSTTPTLAGFYLDYDGTSRGPKPDVGADEGTFIMADLSGPGISYAPLTHTLSLSGRILNDVKITDKSNVNNTTGTKPRIYFKKSTDANDVTGWKYTEATNGTSPFTFTIDYSLLNSPVAINDIIQYFIVAQDAAAAPNVSINNGIYNAVPVSVNLATSAFPITGNINSYILKTGISGNYTVGVSAPTYHTLTEVANDLNSKIITGPLTFELIDPTYTSPSEIFPIVFNANLGSSAINTVTIRPTIGVYPVVSGSASQLIKLNGFDYLTIDGRQGGVSVSDDLTFENTNISGSVLQFINDASNDTIKYVKLKGVATSPTIGVVHFGTALTTGNDNNVINFCTISNGASLPYTGVYALGTGINSTYYNNNNEISNCYLSNFWNPTGESNAFKIADANTGWRFVENSIYQTAPRTATGAAQFFAFNLNSNGTSDSMFISNNFVGGSDAYCIGTPFTLTGGTCKFTGAYLNGGHTIPHIFANNTFDNFDITTGATDAIIPGVWSAVNLQESGIAHITDNTFGNMNLPDRIVITATANGGSIFPLALNSSAPYVTMNITGNNFGGFTLKGSTSANGMGMSAISINGGTSTTNYAVSYNTIGGLLPNNIITAATGSTQALTGIQYAGNGNVNYIMDNIIQNMSNRQVGTSGFTTGILQTGGASIIGNNYIGNISAATQATTSGINAPLRGIVMTSTIPNQTIAGNTIVDLKADTTLPAAVNVTGIVYSGSSSGTNRIERNTVFGLSSGSTSTNTQLNGIELTDGTCTIQNNMISLGFDFNGTAMTNSYGMNGILKSGGNMNAFYNTVSVGGSVAGTAVANTYAFRKIADGTDSVYNNIFINKRSNTTTGGNHFCVGLNSNTTLSQNNNDLYASGSGTAIGMLGSTSYPLLTNWVAATGKDAASVNETVQFAGSNDLHLTGTSMGNMLLKGIPIAGVNKDLDGNLRNATPYMGADEVPSHPLPVTLFRFTATVQGEDALLNWATASELNNDHFVVEKTGMSKEDWQEIGVVKGKGTTSTISNYQFKDVNAFTYNNILYRLRQVDANGAISFSQILALQQNHKQQTTNNKLLVYPNPVETSFTIQFESQNDGTATLTITSLAGVSVSKESVKLIKGINTFGATIGELQKGIYLLTIEASAGDKQTVKLFR
jgi:hypothetical protein